MAAVGAQGLSAPAFRVRTQIPAGELSRSGIDLIPFPLFSASLDERFHNGSAAVRARALLAARRGLARRLREQVDTCQTTLVQRQVDILPSRRLELAAVGDRRLVLDVDDAVWLDAGRQAGGHPLAFLKGTRSKIRWLAARADHVVAGNEYLAEWLAEVNDQVSLVPSLVAPEGVALRHHVNKEHVTLGWIGSATTARYLTGLIPALEKLADAAPHLTWELCAVGGSVPPLRGVTCRSVPWTETTERELLSRMDIGLMPLPDDAWTRGKCAYKALVYMSAGIPVVADDVGVTARVIGHGRGGLIAGSQSDWVEALVELARDSDSRAQMGSEGRRRVEREFSTRVWAPRLAAILRGQS